MQVLLMPNLDKPNAVPAAKAVAEQLSALGVGALLDQRLRAVLPLPEARYVPFEEAAAGCDAILAIGGDGTILHAARHAVAADKPLLGVNVGRLGFMAGLELSELGLLKKLVDGSYQTEERMLLDCLHDSRGKTKHTQALNDVVVSNGALSRMVDLDILCGGRELTSYRADGVIFSTPTGSTAYTLSAGGPIIDPAVSCICMTPICPHSLFSRTIMFSDRTVLCVRPSPISNPVYVTVDGRQGEELCRDDTLEIRRSKQVLRLIILKDRSFYETLSQKFKLHDGREF